jgi:hypothetical protein
LCIQAWAGGGLRDSSAAEEEREGPFSGDAIDSVFVPDQAPPRASGSGSGITRRMACYYVRISLAYNGVNGLRLLQIQHALWPLPLLLLLSV